MKTFDWIIVGAGITGATLGYELAKKGLTVLLLEQNDLVKNATRFSYGGLAFWSGTTDLTRQLCHEGIEIHRYLSEELDTDTQFRELDLLLTIAAVDDPEKVAASYAQFAIAPRLLSVEAACELEPLLNPKAIAGALTVPHGHISPTATTQGYCDRFVGLGGSIEFVQVRGFVREGDRVSGVKTATETYLAENVAVCAGGLSRMLLKTAGIPLRLYFTRAEMLEIPPEIGGEVKVRSLIMQAVLQRFPMEAAASAIEVDALWDQPGNLLAAPVLDAGAIQFQDGSIRMGQLSRVLSDPDATVDRAESEAAIRAGVGKFLPALEKLPGTWYDCLVAFSCDRLPLIGAIPNVEGIHIFSGFSNPLVFVPPLAKRFANCAVGGDDEFILQLSPGRFT
ncbi:FAD-binding oxidoreductase [Kamptonema sp. UHCC 0994]|uniref:NAD(P)/FAD-dependent oxidoreductase n=1 Tax=Kamptonema sp. UHCC 0994 TaxID=3031329 RepID=UPI0023BA3AC5|nr:FAD-binding oxidoreductase [Kamptonema sp. UHCC 0994]MDF0554647.1 FAD-binding oxidoreductase [Kamptonema sp. UHCC 0994]